MFLRGSRLIVAAILLTGALCLTACQPVAPGAREAVNAAAEEDRAPVDDPSSRSAEKGVKPSGQGGSEVSGRANRLAGETSPYLLMHAQNPVDWYPWGEEALARARREGKMIFLSIGYSSCYWCHVMERESFMDEQIAALMNRHFVCIKVDREERPDIDDIYMTALQLVSGSGGWPLSMFLTPGAKPVTGGTYFPPRAKRGRPGFLEVLTTVKDVWSREPEKVRAQSDRLVRAVQESMRQRPPVTGLPGPALLDEVRNALAGQYDPRYAGFGYSETNPRRPKFPEPSNLVFLIDRAIRQPKDERSRAMLVGTLEKMAQGGIYDHLGGGFHRYSTDRYWRVPHFEKMLYDNGQLASLYAEAFVLTGRDDFRRVTTGIAEFVLREMTDREGAFYAALDAETDAEEGKFYVWTGPELKQALTEAELSLAGPVYGFSGSPNFEGQYVLQLARPLAESARGMGETEAALEAKLVPLRGKLLEHRGRRDRPLTDTKILTAWNGLMIGGLADAGRLLEHPAYVEAAARAARFVIANLKTDEGRLQRTYTSGKAKLNGYLDDYAFFVSGLLALHQATGDQVWLEEAEALTRKQVELFWDERGGGFYFTSHDHEELIARSKDPSDGALPAGNSVAAENLLYLARALERPEYATRADQTIRAAMPLVRRIPTGAPRMAAALADYLELRQAKAPPKPAAAGR